MNWNLIKVNLDTIYHLIKGVLKHAKLFSSLTAPNHVWLKSLQMGTWHWKQLPVPSILSTCSTEKNLAGKKRVWHHLWYAEKKLRLLIMLFWIVHLNISHFIGKQWKSRRSAHFVGRSQSYPGAELAFESRVPYSWWNTPYLKFHLPALKVKFTTASSNTYVAFTYGICKWLLHILSVWSLSNPLKCVS